MRLFEPCTGRVLGVACLAFAMFAPSVADADRDGKPRGHAGAAVTAAGPGAGSASPGSSDGQGKKTGGKAASKVGRTTTSKMGGGSDGGGSPGAARAKSASRPVTADTGRAAASGSAAAAPSASAAPAGNAAPAPATAAPGAQTGAPAQTAPAGGQGSAGASPESGGPAGGQVPAGASPESGGPETGSPGAGTAGPLGAESADPFAGLPAAADAPARPRSPRRDAPATVTRTVVRTVREAVEVIPAFLWALIAALGVLCLAAAAASTFLAGRTRRLARQRAELLEDVGLLQSALLPPAPAQVSGAVASAAYRPAAGRPAGGDFHDVFTIDDERLGVVVGRVSATGRRALGMTALVRHVLRAYLEGGLQPRNALQVGADVLSHHLGADYGCVTLAVYDRVVSELTWASAGMPPPIVTGAAAFEPVTASAPPPVGMGVPTGTRQTSVVLPAGAVACIFTDGLLDVAPEGERLGYRGAWRELSELEEGEGAQALVDRAAAGTASADDIAAVVLHLGAEAPAADSEGTRRIEELELSSRDLRGERPALFLRDCGVPTDQIDALVAGLRETGQRLGGAVLRVRVGPGVPEAETALRDMDVLHVPVAAGRS